MSNTTIFRKGVCSLLNSVVVNILAQSTDKEKVFELLNKNFTFTVSEIADAFQDSYSYALAAIAAGLMPAEQQGDFWKKLFQSKVENKFLQCIEQDYLQDFVQVEGITNENLSAFREIAVEQCKALAKVTLFQADNVPFSEAELAHFVTDTENFAISDLVLEQVPIALDKRLSAFLKYNELLGNAILFFLHRKLGTDRRITKTLEALQNEGLLLDIHDIKNIVETTEAHLNQALSAKKFAEVAELGEKLDSLQQIDSVIQTHYSHFLEFSRRFTSWAALLNIHIEQVLSAIEPIQGNLKNFHTKIKPTKGVAETILAILKHLLKQSDLSLQIKRQDEFIQHNSNSLKLIRKALQLWKQMPYSSPQFSRLAIGLGSVMSSAGDLEKAEFLLIQAYQNARNDVERALIAFNRFQVHIRQQAYDKALSHLMKAILLNPQRYALHDVHKYPIKRLLGADGMGCIFLCEQRLKKNQKVVVKCFWKTHKGLLDKVFQAPWLIAEMAGEYVPQPLDYGFYDLAKQERAFFVTEYIEGAVDGETWLKQSSKLEVKTGIAVGLQIAKVLQIAHQQGILHLNLKPANILLLKQGTKLSVKIIDFGLAKVAPSLGQAISTQPNHFDLSLFAQSMLFERLDYVPPEQQGLTYYGQPSAKTDVFAFGKTLYRLLTGESPQTLHPKHLASAPELFELLCDCVESLPEKRVDVTTLISRLTDLSQTTQHKQLSGLNIFNKRAWWAQLDDKWKKVFKKAIAIDEPSDSDLDKIFQLQKLDCSCNDLSDLEPLRPLTQLQNFVCSYNKISDLKPLMSLTPLQILDCTSNQISDLEPLRELTQLQNLVCSSNQVSDLEPLYELTQLRVLYCWGNQVSDLEALRLLTQLQDLDCSYNQVSDLKSLCSLTHLRHLYCGGNQLSNLEQISSLTQLQYLDCSENQVSDLEPLRSLTHLQYLDCSENKISHLEPLRPLRHLQELICTQNKVSNLEPLRPLTQLQTFICSDNQISDLNPLRELIQLQYLDCSENKIKELDSLRELTQLRQLACGGNQISDLAPLARLRDLQNLSCSENQISDLVPLRDLNQLQILYCSRNEVSHLEPLTQLQVLYCSRNQISDLEPLRQLTQLEELNCEGNKISGLEPIGELRQLRKLACGGNQVTDLKPLVQLNELRQLDCGGNQISDLEPLRRLTQLRILYCGRNQISHLDALRQLSELQELDCDVNKISDLKHLYSLSDLQELISYGNPVSQAEIEKFKKAVPICIVKEKWSKY